MPRKKGNPKKSGGSKKGAGNALSVSANELARMTPDSKLPKKLQSYFEKNVVTSYEEDRYDDAIGHCNKILELVPNHGETLSMKGLCIYTRGKKGDRETGLKTIQAGLSANKKSSMCWRISGVANKIDGEYGRAIVCYKQALRWEDRNQMRLLNDMGNLQLALGKYSDFEETRHRMYRLNTRERTCSMSVPIACYLAKKWQKGIEFIDTVILAPPISNDPDPIPDAEDNLGISTFYAAELNEIYLLKAKMIYGDGQNKGKILESLKYINHLIKPEIHDNDTKYPVILDHLEILLFKLKIFQEGPLKNQGQAKKILLELIEMNPENMVYHERYLQECGYLQGSSYIQIEDDEKSYHEMIQIYTDMHKKWPKNNGILRIFLDMIAIQDGFKQKMDEYFRLKIKKSVMSLYTDVSTLYLHDEKGRIMDDLMNGYLGQLEAKKNRFSEKDESNSISPGCLLWVNYYQISRLIDIDRFNDALAMVNDSLSRFPTCMDLVGLKARIYKYSGNPLRAYEFMNEARDMDKADRFLNTKCCRYALRAGLVERAQEMIQLFLKKSEGLKVLFRLEVMWYELHRAEAFMSRAHRCFGPALREFTNVYTHFSGFWEVGSDFHRYSYRTVTLRTYIEMLEWAENLRSHPFYKRASIGAINAWIEFDRCKKENLEKREIWEKGSSVETKEEEKHTVSIVDPRGWVLIHEKDPMEEAHLWLKHVSRVASNEPYAHALKMRLALYENDLKSVYEGMLEYLEGNQDIFRVIGKNPHNKADPFFESVRILTQERSDDKKLDDSLKQLESKATRLFYERAFGSQGLKESLINYFEQSLKAENGHLDSILFYLTLYRSFRLVKDDVHSKKCLEYLILLVPQSSLKSCVRVSSAMDHGSSDQIQFNSVCQKKFTLSSVFLNENDGENEEKGTK